VEVKMSWKPPEDSCSTCKYFKHVEEDEGKCENPEVWLIPEDRITYEDDWCDLWEDKDEE